VNLSSAAAIVLAVALSTSGAARAAVSPEDEAADVIQLTQRDGAGGVHVTKSLRDTLSKAAVRAVDIKRVDYQVDRVDELLTITYTVRHRAVAVRPYRLYYGTVLMDDANMYSAQMSIVMSRPGSSAVRVIDLDADDNGRRCGGGSTTTAKGGRVVTQAIPFSCLASLEHARLVSGVGIERRGGGDVAYDTTRRTRDLPLTAYVPPAA
jgi:hypothetical protein